MGGTRDDKELFVAFFCTFPDHMFSGHALEGILAEIAAVSLLSVDQKDRSLNLSGPGQKGLVQETLATDNIPAVVGVAAALVIAAGSLVISMVVLDEPGRILRKRIDYATRTLISS